MSVIDEIGDSKQITIDLLRPAATQDHAPIEIHRHKKYPLITDPDHEEATEDFGVLRTRLLNARAKSGMRSVIVASPQAEEGKSLICINLALSLAQSGRERILLVDGDLRRSGITRLLEQRLSVGLADFLHGRESFGACIRATTSPWLFVAPAGNVSAGSLPVILEGFRWAEFLDSAKQEFGLIIVDSVPVSAPVADFELLLAPCEAALLVVQLRKTTREALDLTTQRLNGKLLGLVVNNTEPRIDADYYAYARGNNKKKERPMGK